MDEGIITLIFPDASDLNSAPPLTIPTDERAISVEYVFPEPDLDGLSDTEPKMLFRQSIDAGISGRFPDMEGSVKAYRKKAHANAEMRNGLFR